MTIKQKIKNKDLINDDELKDVLSEEQRAYFGKKRCFRKRSYEAITKTLEQKFFDVERIDDEKCWYVGERKAEETERRNDQGKHRQKAPWSEASNKLFNNGLLRINKNRSYTAKALLAECGIFLKHPDYKEEIKKILKTRRKGFLALRSKKRLGYDLDVLSDDIYRYVNEQIRQEVKRLIRDTKAIVYPVYFSVKGKQQEEVNDVIFDEYLSRVKEIRDGYAKKDKKQRDEAIKDFVLKEYDCDYMYQAYMVGDISSLEYQEHNELEDKELVSKLFTERLVENAVSRQVKIESYDEWEERINNRLKRPCVFAGGKVRYDPNIFKKIESSKYEEQADFKAKRYREYADIFKTVLKPLVIAM